MKIHTTLTATLLFGGRLLAHDLSESEHRHSHAPSWSEMQGRLAQAKPQTAAVEPTAKSPAPAQAAAFAAFSPSVKTRSDDRYLYIENNGIPAHNLMVGITAWQQQVPLPQPYFGENAWRLPLHPVPAREPASIRDRFLRGAIAIAANGIPIFNPQNNRGEISANIGELDQWGGHCGRADDYHYHAAPLHLQTTLGPKLPIAYALDGYPIFGLTEPDGAEPKGLDALHGHTTPALGYHYHASKQYPFVNGGFHGEVSEVEGQVDPQPRATSLRPALPQLRGARISGFTTSADGKTRTLSYQIESRSGSVRYTDQGKGAWAFVFTAPDGSTSQQTYQARPEVSRPPRGQAPAERSPANEPRPPRGENRPTAPASTSSVEMDALKKPLAGFVLTSPSIPDPKQLPIEFTGDGAGLSPPLAWSGAPAGTKSFVILMDHLTPDATIKTYWTLWDIPATATSLPKNAQNLGKLGLSSRGRIGYEPPHSKGPGAKTYVITLYALSAPPTITAAPGEVTREQVLAAIKDKVLASATLPVTYTRNGDAPQAPAPQTPPSPRAEQAPPQAGAATGLVKAAASDLISGSIYADNWFALYLNGRLVAVDSIEFLPHNVVKLEILPEYPMTLAVIAHDNADPKTGLEYGDHVGDGGFILRFADGTVTDATWKAKAIERGPIGGNLTAPRVENDPRPAGWQLPGFDDSQWESAHVFTREQVNPKQAFQASDFTGASFIWSTNLGTDNTVLFRKRIEKPGWTPRWTALPAGPVPSP
jgi:phosphatidylethanolamine-binding protein (PEBP) family uncharacterized protein